MKKYYFVLIMLSMFSLQGCTTTQTKGKLITSSLSNQQIKSVLNKQYASWKGVNYKMGGTGRSGVDCSGFIYRVFKDGIGINLPRTTELQSKLGHYINKNELKIGDLVFFKTGNVFKSRHIGIYTGGNEFLHASTSRGVMKSNLRNPYWKGAYWHSRRILK